MSTPHDPYSAGGPVPPVPSAPAGTAPGATPPRPAPAPAAYPQHAAGYPQSQGGGAYPPVPPGGYAQPGPGLPKHADQRPKTIALIALILAIVGFLSTCIGFTPIGLVFVIVGGLLLLGGFVLGIVALASRNQGGKGLGLAGLIVSVVGGIVFVFALAVSIFWVAFAAATSSAGEVGSAPAITVPAGTYDENAYIAEVRPQVRDLIKQVQPSLDDAAVDGLYDDDTLIFIGTTLLSEYNTMGDAAVDAEAKSMVDTGAFTEQQADQFMSLILAAAQQHLVR